MADIAHAERIDGLPVVTDGKKVSVFEQQGGNLLVQVVGILVLVAKNVLKLGPVALPDVCMVPQQVAGQQQNIVKIDCIGRFEDPFVPRVYIGQADVALPGMAVKIGIGMSAVFGIGNLSEHGHGIFFIVIEG
jgi:hypothetical protein